MCDDGVDDGMHPTFSLLAYVQSMIEMRRVQT